MTDLVEIQLIDSSVETPDAEQIRSWVSAVFTILKRSPLALTVRVVGEEEMAKLNGRYRGRKQPTNVLSFPFDDLPGVSSGILGDILVCPAVLRREVADSTTSLDAHWAHMVIHGVLHLCGYDHQSDRDATVMEGLERDVLKVLGLPDPYRLS